MLLDRFFCKTLFTAIFLFISVLDLSAEKVGLLLTLSGAAAEVGADCQRGVNLARSFTEVKELEESGSLSFVTEDCRSEPKVAVDAFKKLVSSDQVSAVLTLRSPIGMAINPISKSLEVPLLAAVGHPDFVPQNEFAYQIWPVTSDEAGSLADYLIDHKLDTLSVLSTEDEWTNSLSNALINLYEAKGGKVIFNETVLPTETDLSSVLTRVRNKKAKAVFFNFTLSQGGYALKKAAELRVGGEYFSNYWAGYPSFIEAAGSEATRKIGYPEVKLDYEQFQTRFLELYRNEYKPSAMTFSCYLGTFAVSKALKDCTNRKEALKQCLIEQKEVELPDSKLMVKDRMVKFDIPIKWIVDSKLGK